MMIFLNTNLLRKELKIKAGVYGIINTKTSKQYIGSSRLRSLNLYSRLMDHIKGRESNLRLQRSIHKDGLSFFKPLAPAWDQGEGLLSSYIFFP